MTTLQKLQLKQSEIREKLNTLLGKDERSEEQQGELATLTAEGQQLEPEIRAAIIASPAPEETLVSGGTEDRELAQLTERANVGDILSATFEKRQTSGEAAELQKHFGLGSHQVPLEMLRINRSSRGTRCGDGPGEHRRRQSQAPVIVLRYSASGDGAFLGIERPTVPVGDAAYPVLSTVPSVKGPFTGSDNAAQTDAEFVANNLSPERLQASFSYRRTDAARFAGLDAALRLALERRLAGKALDQQAISRQTTGCWRQRIWTTTTSRTTVSTFALYLSAACCTEGSMVRFARTPSDVRMIVGAGHVSPMRQARLQGEQQRRIRR